MIKLINFITKANIVHHNKYDYSKSNYINSKEKIVIICKEHGEFLQTPNSHLNGKGCPQCRNSYLRSLFSDSKEKFIKKAILIHGSKNFDYSSVIYVNNRNKVEIICPIHGSFFQTPSDHLNGYGCPQCGKLSCSFKNKDSHLDFINKSKNIHGFKYNYSQVNYISSKDKVNIVCPIHGTFTQKPNDHIQGYGCPKCGMFDSSLEKFIYNFLDNYNIKYIKNDRKILLNKEIDIFIPNHNIGIECHGIYWHSELIKENKNYHLNKLLLAEKQGIKLIQIFENEILLKPKIIASRLKSLLNLNKYSIYARKCEIKEIENNIKNKFLNKYHIQGQDKSLIKLGLFYKNRLVSVMTFCKYRTALGRKNIESEYELSRFCCIHNFNIVGGASKLLKHFERIYKPKKIISYADRRWSQGNLYYKLKFNFVQYSQPNYWYFKNNSLKLYHRFNFRKSILSKKIQKFDPNLTEWENMKNNNYNRIWDCGNMLFIKEYFV